VERIRALENLAKLYVRLLGRSWMKTKRRILWRMKRMLRELTSMIMRRICSILNKRMMTMQKKVGGLTQESQLSENAYKEDDNMNDGFQLIKGKKGKSKAREPAEGVRRSSRLEAYEDVKVTDMVISRAKAKDALIHKGNSSNPF
jgi:hypothetical protein